MRRSRARPVLFPVNVTLDASQWSSSTRVPLRGTSESTMNRMPRPADVQAGVVMLGGFTVSGFDSVSRRSPAAQDEYIPGRGMSSPGETTLVPNVTFRLSNAVTGKPGAVCAATLAMSKPKLSVLQSNIAGSEPFKLSGRDSLSLSSIPNLCLVSPGYRHLHTTHFGLPIVESTA